MKIDLLLSWVLRKPFPFDAVLALPGALYCNLIASRRVQRRYVEHQLIVHRSARLTQKLIDAREQDWQHKSGSTNARMRRLKGE